jgi:hypothetical protein
LCRERTVFVSEERIGKIVKNNDGLVVVRKQWKRKEEE